MKQHILVAVGAIALLLAVGVADVQAAKRSVVGTRAVRVQRSSAARTVHKTCVYPRTRQVGGKTLWDLGKQKGQWPSLR